MVLHREELIKKCRERNHIYIYGAGKNAGAVYLFLQEHGMETEGFLVTDRTGNPEYYYGRPVGIVETFDENKDYLILVPVVRTGKAYKEIFNHLVKHHVQNVYFLPKEILMNILEEVQENVLVQKIRACFNCDLYYRGENIPVEIYHSILVMRDADGQEYHWRFRNRAMQEQDFGSIAAVFEKRTALEEFESQYGRYHIFRTIEQKPLEEGRTCTVYMARSHADKVEVQSEIPSWPVPIQVGAALTDADICSVKDNTGDNISERNGNYSECTAIYWMWKNAPEKDYIGLCHYRRHFDLEEEELRCLGDSNVDVLVTSPTFVRETIGTFFSTLIPKADIQVLLDAINSKCPEYAPSAEKFFASRFYPPCNLFIMRYDLFQEYAEFVFTVTFEIEHFYQELGFYRKDRYMGYLVECLLGIFLMQNKERLKIAYTDMRFYS